ncbi:MAG: universal stress protein [Bilophila sp.]
MFNRILFATSGTPGSDNAAKLAFDLTERQQASLTMFHCYGLPSRGFSHDIVDVRSGCSEQADASYQEWVLEELRTTYSEQIKACTRPFTMETTVGIPSTELLRLARKTNPDLIVMGASSTPGDPNAARLRTIVGNTVREVARRARCPVFIVNRPCTTCWHLFSNIVFCTDFSECADAAFTFALQTAMELEAKLYLVHAVDLGSTGMGLDQSEIERREQKMKERIEKEYVSRMGKFSNYEILVREGVPYMEILKVARENGADLIVMAHHSKDLSIEDADIGSTVEQVVLRSACPVASVTRQDKLE